MPESQVFQIIIQFGSFGLLVYAIVWLLRVGWPEIRDTIKTLAAAHASAVSTIASQSDLKDEKHVQAIAELGDRHEKAVATLVTEQTNTIKGLVGEHTKTVQTLDKNCREERIQMASLLQRSHPDIQKPV